MRKKITLLFAALLAFIGVTEVQAWVQPEVSTETETYEYYIMNYRNQAYFVTTTNGLNGGAQNLGSANEFTEAKAKLKFKLTADGKLYSTNTTTPLIVGYTGTGEAANSVQLFAADNNYTWNIEASSENNYSTLSAGTSNNSWNMHGGAGANIGLYRKSDGGSTWVFVPANDAAEALYAPSTEYYYQIKNVAYSRMLAANANKATVTATNSVTDFNQLWAFEQGEDGAFYLRNAGQGKYLGNSTSNNTAWPVVDAGNKIAFEVKNANVLKESYYIKYVGGDDYSCAHDANWGQEEQVVRWVASADASQWYLERTDVSVDALAISFVYSLTYKGEQKYAQQCTGLVGADYPDVTVALPYGIVANKPTGELTAGVAGTTVEVELTENLPFESAESYEDAEKDWKWCYLQFHATRRTSSIMMLR